MHCPPGHGRQWACGATTAGTAHDHGDQRDREAQQHELVGDPEQQSHVQLDAPCGELCRQGPVGEPRDVGHLCRGAVDSHRVVRHHPGLPGLRHGERGVRVRGNPDLDIAADPGIARCLQHRVDVSHHGGVGPRCGGGGRNTLMPLVTGHGAGHFFGCAIERRRHGRCRPRQRGPQGRDVVAGEPGPGETCGRQEQQSDGDPDPHRPMPVQHSRSTPEGAVERQQPGLFATPPRHTPVSAPPQEHPGQRDQPQPRCRQFAVHAARLAEMQAAVHLVDPGPQWQCATAAVHREFPVRGARHRIDEDGMPFGLAQ